MAKKINKGTGRVEHDVLKRKLGTFSDNRKSENLSPIAKEDDAISQINSILDYCLRNHSKDVKEKEDKFESINKENLNTELEEEFTPILPPPEELEQQPMQEETPVHAAEASEPKMPENDDYRLIGTGQGMNRSEDVTAFGALTSWKQMNRALKLAKDYDYAEKLFERDEEERVAKLDAYYQENELNVIAKRKPIGTGEELDNVVNSVNRLNKDSLRKLYGSKIGQNGPSKDHVKINDDYEDRDKNTVKINSRANRRAREEILNNARKNVASKAKNFVCGYMDEISGGDNELGREAASAKKNSNKFIKPVIANIAGTKYARSKLNNARFYGIDKLLGSEDHELQKTAAKLRNRDDLERMKSKMQSLSISKFGEDITVMNSKELAAFAKKGKEQKEAADFLKTIRDVNRFTPQQNGRISDVTNNVKSFATASVLASAQRSEFFQGKNKMASFAPLSLTRASSKYMGGKLKEAVKKRYFKVSEGYIRSSFGAAKASNEGSLSELGRKIKTKKDNLAEKANKKANIGHKRTVDNKHGNLLNKKKPNAFSSKASNGLGRNAAKAASTSAADAAAGSQLAAVKKVAEKTAAKTFGKWLAGTGVAKGLTAVANAIGVSTGGLGYIVIGIIGVLMFIICLSCSCGVNDLFSTGSPFTLQREGKRDMLAETPDESYGAETMYLLDAYLSRNYEYICKRGLEEEISKSIEGENTMSIKDAFTVQMGGWLNYNATGDTAIPDLTEEDLAADPGEFEGAGTETALNKDVKFDGGKVSVVTHKAEERVTTTGEDVSTPERFVISFINGVKADFNAPGGASDDSPTITYDAAKEFTNKENPSLIERYVYDVESHNSIFYTDIDHSIVPDIGNIIAVDNSKTIGQKVSDATVESKYASLKSGELTPLSNAVFDNTKEIISMAITAFDNNFVLDSDNNGIFPSDVYRNKVNSNQFQYYCYGMWLKSHYVSVKKDGEAPKKNGVKALWSLIIGSEDSKPLEEKMKESIENYYLTNIHPFGEIKNNFEKGIDADVNYIAPFNKFHYSPELYHYGLYQLSGEGTMAQADDYADTKNHKPNVIQSSSMERLQSVEALRLQNTNEYYNPDAGLNHHILASKLPILNIANGDELMFNFDGVGEIGEGYVAKITSGDNQHEFTELKDIISTAKTINYRYFANNSKLVRESGSSHTDIPVTNDNSFVYTESFMVDHEPIITKEGFTHTFEDNHYWNDYSDEDFILEEGADENSDFETVNLIDGSNALESALNEIGLVDELETTAEHYEEIEKSFTQAFYNAFGTNTGIDEDEAYTYPKYKTMTYSGDTPSFKTDKKINYNDTLLTDCGVQEAYAGSPLLNAINSSKYPVKGNKDILMSVLEETNDANDLIADEDDTYKKLGQSYYKGLMHAEITSAPGIAGNTYSYSGLSSDLVGDDIPVVIITQQHADSLEEAKELMKDYYRGILVYVEYSNTETVDIVGCNSPCGYCMSHVDGDGDHDCNCDADTCEDYDTKDGSERTAVEYKITIVECYPQAEFCGFYLCGGHTQIAIMPVTLSYTGSTTLFDVELSEADLAGLDKTSYFMQILSSLNKIWDTNLSNEVIITGTDVTNEPVSYAKVAKQNRINAVEALGDSWEHKYLINYGVLRDKSNAIADELNAASAAAEEPYYSSTPSNLKKANYKEGGNIDTRYKIAGSGADSSAQYISTEDLSVILSGVKAELIAKLGEDAPLEEVEGRLDNEYENRLERVSRALSKVGKVGYSQTNHQWNSVSPITGDGGKVDYNDLMYKTDCSGFCSWVIGLGLHPGFDKDGKYLPTTTTIFTTGNRAPIFAAIPDAYEFYDAGALKPGDLAFKDGHVIMYAYTDETSRVRYYVDCTSAGGKLGNGGVEFAGMGQDSFDSKYSKGFISIKYDVYPDVEKEFDSTAETP